MKLKTRSRYHRHTRRFSMPRHRSTLPAEHAADAAHGRVSTFRRMKLINRLPRGQMSKWVMEQLFGAD